MSDRTHNADVYSPWIVRFHRRSGKPIVEVNNAMHGIPLHGTTNIIRVSDRRAPLSGETPSINESISTDSQASCQRRFHLMQLQMFHRI